jgi:hypothetical protein
MEGSVLYELPYLWKSIDNEVVTPWGFSGQAPHTPSYFPQKLTDNRDPNRLVLDIVGTMSKQRAS